MTPEQAAAARVREAVAQANLCMPPLSTVIVATDDAAGILAALDAAQAAAQAPREVPRLTEDELVAVARGAGFNIITNLETVMLDRIGRAVESRVREMCGVAP